MVQQTARSGSSACPLRMQPSPCFQVRDRNQPSYALHGPFLGLSGTSEAVWDFWGCLSLPGLSGSNIQKYFSKRKTAPSFEMTEEKLLKYGAIFTLIKKILVFVSRLIRKISTRWVDRKSWVGGRMKLDRRTLPESQCPCPGDPSSTWTSVGFCLGDCIFPPLSPAQFLKLDEE